VNVALLNPPSFARGRVSRGLMGGYGMRVGDGLLYPPIQLAYAAAVLERRGHQVEIVDAEARGDDEEATARALAQSGAELIALSLSKDAFDRDIALGRALRARLHRQVCAFGPMASTHRRDVLGRDAADFVLIGEPDVALADLVDALEAKRAFPIPGLAYRTAASSLAPGSSKGGRGDGPIAETEGRHEVADLDALPFPARHLLDNGRYRFPGVDGRVTAIHSSRGCPIECPFCPYVFAEGSALRQRSPDNVVDEMAHAHRTFGIEVFVFRDPVFTLKTARVREICRRLVELDLPLRWLCETTVGSLSEDLLGEMARAGCIAVSFGVESANEALQRKYGRNKIGSFDHALRMVDACRRLGLTTRAFFMLGFPEETPAMMAQTIDYARRMDPDTVQFVPVTGYPGTPLGDEHGDVLQRDAARAREVRTAIRRAYRRFYARPSRLRAELVHPRRLLHKLARYRAL